MSLFANVNKSTSDKVKGETDSLGQSRIFDTGVVDFEIEIAFITTSDGGAMALNIHAKEIGGSRTLKKAEWIYSGNAKGNKNTYEKDGVDYFLPGWNTGNAITRLAADRELASLCDDDITEKTIKLWDGKAKAETNQKVNAIDFLRGTKISFGVQKVIEDKNVKNDQGKYVPSGQTRDDNEIDKVFHSETGFTLKELLDGKTADDAPEFRNKWLEKYTPDFVKDKSTKDVSGAKAGGVAANTQAAATQGSLFTNQSKG